MKSKHPLQQPNPSLDNPDPREVHIQVMADIEGRSRVGKKRYGQTLRPFNGRSALKDAYEEILDLAMYIKQLLMEEETNAHDS